MNQKYEQPGKNLKQLQINRLPGFDVHQYSIISLNKMTDRIVRNEGSVLNYVKIDHLTALNTVGKNGGIELSRARTAIITNNVLANVVSIGHTDAHAAEQQQADGHFAAITLDTIFQNFAFLLVNFGQFHFISGPTYDTLYRILCINTFCIKGVYQVNFILLDT